MAIDRDGDLTIIELKRDRTPRDIVAQILDYASWVSALSAKDIRNIASERLGKTLKAIFSDAFGTEVPENLNMAHNMVIVASELDPASKRIVEYLSEVHDVGINTLFFSTFEHDGTRMMGTDWLMDQETVVTRSDKKKAPWTGSWYVNIGDCKERGYRLEDDFCDSGREEIHWGVCCPIRRLQVASCRDTRLSQAAIWSFLTRLAAARLLQGQSSPSRLV